MAEIVLFVGPSAFGAGLERAAHLEIRPPARRGDVESLLSTQRAGVAIVCDGVFGSTPAVGHAEICRAIDAGWSVWGVSSIGAIRAHELACEGMRGYGYVYRQFARFRDFRDDEVALLHFPEPPYFPLSEPLVNLRYALERHVDALGMTATSRAAVIEALARRWFGDRTEQFMRRSLVRQGGLSVRAADRLMKWMCAHRVKTLDLLDLLRTRPWLDGAATARPTAAGQAPRRGSSPRLRP